MNINGGSGDVIINPRYRRSSVLKALHEIIAGCAVTAEVICLEREDTAVEPGGTGDGGGGRKGGEEDDVAGHSRVTGVQRNI